MLASSQVPQLVEVDGPNAGRSHPLPYGELLVGRAGRVDVRLDHVDVSRKHVRLEVGPEGVVVHDLGSKNGVWVDGQQITAPAALGHDDRVSLGDLTLRIIHPASQVTRALQAGGETTVTTHRPTPPPEVDLRSLWAPLLGVLLFGVLVAMMLVR